jgi:8-oxo-dGTP diphosphatase
MKAGIDFVGVTTPFYCHDGEGNLLMHKRSNNCRDEHGRWDTGSGQLDFGISLAKNVLKEVMEEYCCEGIIEVEMPAHDIFREQNGINTHWIAVPFIIKVNANEVKIGEPHKIDEIGWFGLDNLPTPLHSGFDYTFNKYRNYFDKYISR